MQTLRVAFLSALVLELLATLSVALVAVSVGLRLVEGRLDLFTGLVVLILAPEVYLPLRAVGARFHDSRGRPRRRVRGVRGAGDAGARRCRSGPGARPGPGRDPLEGVASTAGRAGSLGRAGPAAGAGATVLGVRGPSGGGKSTLVDLLLGLRTPDEGRVLVGGVDLADVDRDAWLRRIAWVPQRSDVGARHGRRQHPVGSARRAAGDGSRQPPRRPRSTSRSTPRSARTGTGCPPVSNVASRSPERVLADRPLLLLDEPTEGVDADTEAAIIEALAPGRGGTHRRAGQPPAGAARRVRPAAHDRPASSPRPSRTGEPLAPEVPRAPVAPHPRPAGSLGPHVRHAPPAGALRWSLSAARGQWGRLALRCAARRARARVRRRAHRDLGLADLRGRAAAAGPHADGRDRRRPRVRARQGRAPLRRAPRSPTTRPSAPEQTCGSGSGTRWCGSGLPPPPACAAASCSPGSSATSTPSRTC